MERNRDRFNTVLGIVVFAGLITGALALLGALLAALFRESIAAGLCLVAAALAFGLTANAILRN